MPTHNEIFSLFGIVGGVVAGVVAANALNKLRNIQPSGWSAPKSHTKFDDTSTPTRNETPQSPKAPQIKQLQTLAKK